MSTTSSIVLTAVVAALGTPPPEPFYVDVRTYLPEDFVTDGSVDYKPYIQRCFDENLCVVFPGSDDADRPMVYGVTAETVGKLLQTRPHSRIRFGPNAVLKRLPSKGDLLCLGSGTYLTGAVVDGNKYAHWPLVKDHKVEYYAFVIGCAIVMRGKNVIRDCFVYDNAGIAFGGWHASDNKIYRSRAENCGFLEAMGTRQWGGEHASGDGFIFTLASGYNLVKDCEAIDCVRWDFLPGTDVHDSTFVDCR
ncbi:MAG: right-handed parallel beta-helix repeat-containing protein, partial [Phycisphaeraceae bacterium]|nr:right-handed parallel beta-helix repeat-containing protein [Phycisphaeraceae bacterium]